MVTGTTTSSPSRSTVRSTVVPAWARTMEANGSKSVTG